MNCSVTTAQLGKLVIFSADKRALPALLHPSSSVLSDSDLRPAARGGSGLVFSVSQVSSRPE